MPTPKPEEFRRTSGRRYFFADNHRSWRWNANGAVSAPSHRGIFFRDRIPDRTPHKTAQSAHFEEQDLFFGLVDDQNDAFARRERKDFGFDRLNTVSRLFESEAAVLGWLFQVRRTQPVEFMYRPSIFDCLAMDQNFVVERINRIDRSFAFSLNTAPNELVVEVHVTLND